MTKPECGTTAPDAPWYRRAFQARYLELYAHRNEADAARAVDFIEELHLAEVTNSDVELLVLPHEG